MAQPGGPELPLLRGTPVPVLVLHCVSPGAPLGCDVMTQTWNHVIVRTRPRSLGYKHTLAYLSLYTYLKKQKQKQESPSPLPNTYCAKYQSRKSNARATIFKVLHRHLNILTWNHMSLGEMTLF